MIALVLFLAIYFIPTMVGCANGKDNKGGIFVLNLFLGWTLLFWVVALVWACCANKQPAQPQIIYVHVPAEVKA